MASVEISAPPPTVVSCYRHDPYGARVIADDEELSPFLLPPSPPAYRSPSLHFDVFIVEINGRPREYVDVYNVLHGVMIFSDAKHQHQHQHQQPSVFVMIPFDRGVTMGVVRCRVMGKTVTEHEMKAQKMMHPIYDVLSLQQVSEIETERTLDAKEIHAKILSMPEKLRSNVTIHSVWMQADRSSLEIRYQVHGRKRWEFGNFVREVYKIAGCRIWMFATDHVSSMSSSSASQLPDDGNSS